MARVLTVESTAASRSLGAALRAAGHQVSICTSRKAALRALRQRNFEIMIADWQVARAETVNAARRAGSFVILLSKPSSLNQAYRMGSSANLLLEKPAKKSDLRTIVEVIAARRQPQAARAAGA